VVELVDRTVASGLVCRESNPRDRREVLVSLTPLREAVLERLSTVTQNELLRLAPALREMLERLEHPERQA